MLGGQGALWFPTHVQITVIQSRGLRGKGKQGLNDAYTIIQLGKEKFATTVIEKTLCPRWQEECTFELPSDASDEKASVLRLVVMHRALLGMDSFLGQASLPLRELYQDTGRKKTQWYSLQSKPGEKSKERGEIEVSIQFLRNNMTASMFDLSHHEKPRSTLGKLKNKVKGKKSISDSVSAVVPSSAAMGSTDEDDVEKKKKKGLTLGFLGKSPMQKNQLSRSMLTLTTGKSGGGLPFFKGRAGSAGGESDSDSIGSSSTLSISENASGTPSKGNLSPSPSPQHRSLGRSSTEDLHKGKKLKVPFFSKLNEKKNKNKDEEEEEEVTMPPNEYRPSPSVNPFFKEEKVKLQDKPGVLVPQLGFQRRSGVRRSKNAGGSGSLAVEVDTEVFPTVSEREDYTIPDSPPIDRQSQRASSSALVSILRPSRPDPAISAYLPDTSESHSTIPSVKQISTTDVRRHVVDTITERENVDKPAILLHTSNPAKPHDNTTPAEVPKPLPRKITPLQLVVSSNAPLQPLPLPLFNSVLASPVSPKPGRSEQNALDQPLVRAREDEEESRHEGVGSNIETKDGDSHYTPHFVELAEISTTSCPSDILSHSYDSVLSEKIDAENGISNVGTTPDEKPFAEVMTQVNVGKSAYSHVVPTMSHTVSEGYREIVQETTPENLSREDDCHVKSARLSTASTTPSNDHYFTAVDDQPSINQSTYFESILELPSDQKPGKMEKHFSAPLLVLSGRGVDLIQNERMGEIIREKDEDLQYVHSVQELVKTSSSPSSEVLFHDSDDPLSKPENNFMSDSTNSVMQLAEWNADKGPIMEVQDISKISGVDILKKDASSNQGVLDTIRQAPADKSRPKAHFQVRSARMRSTGKPESTANGSLSVVSDSSVGRNTQHEKRMVFESTSDQVLGEQKLSQNQNKEKKSGISDIGLLLDTPVPSSSTSTSHQFTFETTEDIENTSSNSIESLSNIEASAQGNDPHPQIFGFELFKGPEKPPRISSSSQPEQSLDLPPNKTNRTSTPIAEGLAVSAPLATSNMINIGYISTPTTPPWKYAEGNVIESPREDGQRSCDSIATVEASPSKNISLQAVKPIPVQPVEGSRKKLVPSVVLTDMLNSEGDSTGDDQGPWTHLTRAELQQLIVRSEVALKERDDRIQALENYIDHLLVRVMEETPSMLRKDRRTSRKAGRIC